MIGAFLSIFESLPKVLQLVGIGKYFISEPLLYMQLKYLFNLLVRNYKAIFFVLTFEIPTSFSCINAIYSGNCIYAACEQSIKKFYLRYALL